MTAPSAAPAPPRACGDCGLCCKIMGVEAIAKPPRKWCGHFRKGRGCSIYADRPSACGAFNCTWLLAPNLGDEWRPDRAGFVMHSEDGGQRLVVEADGAAPQAWRREPYQATLRDWARTIEVVVFVADRGLRLRADGGETAVRRGSPSAG
ncbi:MAG: YkgJ family cysteine cluster protein [Brevundimonas sp.]|uniref:YkgJ family cysteine cluster protein n=1 Tax=Brevundimonas sp. TaxID=1871086 RepID=UPI00391C8F0F